MRRLHLYHRRRTSGTACAGGSATNGGSICLGYGSSGGGHSTNGISDSVGGSTRFGEALVLGALGGFDCGTSLADGGFGGGGAGNSCNAMGGGGGGGYSGGGNGVIAGGGGSYSWPFGSNLSVTAGANSGVGKIIVRLAP